MKYEFIILTVQDNIGWIRFNRPDKLNAMNTALVSDFEKAIMECEQDENVRVVILTGNEKAFIAGADIEPMSKADVSAGFRLTEHSMKVQERLADLPKPTISAICRCIGFPSSTPQVLMGSAINPARCM